MRSRKFVVCGASALVLVAAAGPGWAFGVDAATFAASALLLTRLRVPERAERGGGFRWTAERCR